jgi:hypothetical protein
MPINPIGTYLKQYAMSFIQEKVTQFLFNFPIVKATGSSFRSNENVMTLREIAFMEPEKLSDEPLDLVSCHRVSCFATDGDPEPRHAQPVLGVNDRKVRRLLFPARPIYFDKVRRVQ